MLRAIGIEFRTHLQERIWQELLRRHLRGRQHPAGDLLRRGAGQRDARRAAERRGYFFEPLWTNWRVGAQNGILDWYTVMCGVVALVTLVVHGSLYLATKTEATLNYRARKVASGSVAGAGAADHLQPDCDGLRCARHVLGNYSKWPVGYLVPALVIGSLGYMYFADSQRNEKGAFLASCALHSRHAGGSGLCALSQGAAREHRLATSA